MSESKSLDELLNDDEPATSDDVAPVEGEGEGQPRDENGRFASKGEEQPQAEEGASPAPEAKQEPPLEHPALLGERRRRQEAEARARELEQMLQSYQQPKQQAENDAPDIFEDPAGYTAWLREQTKQELLQELRGQRQQTSFEARLEVSEMLAREKHPDFEEKLAVFEDLVRQNPALAVELRNHRNPAEYAYTTAKNYAEVKQFGDFEGIDALKEKIRQELIAEAAATKPAIPSSLATERNVGSRSGPAWSGPKPLSELLS